MIQVPGGRPSSHALGLSEQKKSGASNEASCLTQHEQSACRALEACSHGLRGNSGTPLFRSVLPSRAGMRKTFGRSSHINDQSNRCSLLGPCRHTASPHHLYSLAGCGKSRSSALAFAFAFGWRSAGGAPTRGCPILARFLRGGIPRQRVARDSALKGCGFSRTVTSSESLRL